MYSKTDMLIITNGYFKIISLKYNDCILKSKNTKHSWRITKGRNDRFILRHKHHDGERFHFHRCCSSIKDCLLEIIGHDEYQLRGRKPATTKKWTYFDYIIDIYNNTSLCASNT